MTTVNGIQVDLLPGMQVITMDGERVPDHEEILYNGTGILMADPDYKPELRPGPFFVDDTFLDELVEMPTLQAAKDYIDEMGLPGSQL